MAQVTDPALLAELNGAAPEAAPQSTPQSAGETPSSGRVTDAALLAELNGNASAAPEEAPQEPAAQPAPANQFGFPTFASQEDLNNYYTKMLQDPKVSTQRIRDFFTANNSKISTQIDDMLVARENFLKANPGQKPAMSADPNRVAEQIAPGEIADNREYSYWQGVANGGMDVLGNVLGGANWLSDQVGATNTWGRDARQGLEDWQDTFQYQEHPVGNMVGRAVTVLPTMAATAPLEAAGVAVGLPVAAARGGALLLEGAAQGALTTNGETPGEVLKDAAIGGGINLGLGGLGDIATRRLASGVRPTEAARNGREVLEAASRLTRDGVTVKPTPAMTGGTLAQGIDAVAEAGLVSNAIRKPGVDAVVSGLEAARDRAARSLLPAGETTVRGINDVSQDVLSGAGGLGKYADEAQATADVMYADAAKLAQGVEFDTPRTLAKLDDIIAKMKSRPGDTPGLAAMERLRADLAPTPGTTTTPGLLARLFLRRKPTTTAATPSEFSVESLRDLRTGFGDNFDNNQRAIAAAAKQLWGPLSDDIQAGLIAKGRTEAAKAYKAADAFYKTAQDNIENIVQPIVGNRSAEQLGSHLVRLSKTKSRELDDALALMDPAIASRVRAAIVGDLGRANPGAQTATGDAFSSSVFGRDWNGLLDANSPTFTGGAVGQDLADIARVSQGVRDGGALRNSSGTGRVANAFNWLTSLKGATTVGGATTLGPLATGAIETTLGLATRSNRLARAGVALGEARVGTKAGLRTLQTGSKTRSFWNALGTNSDTDSQDEF